MQRSLTGLYATAVCFAAVICATVAAGVVLYSGVRALAPGITAVGYQSQLHAPVYTAPIHVNPQFFPAPPGAVLAQPIPSAPLPSPKEMERLRRESSSYTLQVERGAGTRALILWGIVLVVSSVLWVLHWRLMKSEQGGAA